LDKRNPLERIVHMSAQGQEQEHNQTATAEGSGADGRAPAQEAASTPPGQADAERALQTDERVVEIDERHAKMERLRAEGIEPYPHARLPDRTPVARVLANHDPAQLSQ